MSKIEKKINIPEIKKLNGLPTLYVKNEPFFALAGEIHNSSAYDLKFMESQVWKKIENLNLNTLLVPLYWEMIEPQEGCFQFEILDGIIGQARKKNKHLVFLWFGLWKNGESMYVPKWMKQDSEKYYRAETIWGEKINTISPLCSAAVIKDAEAFSAVMEHIRKVDEEYSTVIAMQVENEIGLLETDCDYGVIARKELIKPIPKELAEEYQTSGTWENVFGVNAGEYFMAYYFAKSVELIAAAGRSKYPLPCYTNAWLKQFPWYPGSYPSGGPVKDVHRIWKCVAPSLFTLAPDIYVPYTADVLEEYSYEGNPLFIPEIRKDAVTASYCLHAFTKYHALCYSPFGIEDLGMEPEEVHKFAPEVMQALNINPLVFETEGGAEFLSKTYELVDQIKPLCLKYRGTEHMQSFVKKSDTDLGIYFHFEEYEFQVDYLPPISKKPVASGVIFELDKNKFILAGMMSTLKVRIKPGEKRKAGVLKLQEGIVQDGKWQMKKSLNGDEQMILDFGESPTCLYMELYKY